MVNNRYPLAVWLTTIIVGPLLFILFLALNIEKNQLLKGQLHTLYPFLLLYSLLLSLPAFVIYYMAFRMLVVRKAPAIRIKLLLSSVALLTLAITHYLLFFMGAEMISGEDFVVPSCYALVILMGGLAFKLKTKEA